MMWVLGAFVWVSLGIASYAGLRYTVCDEHPSLLFCLFFPPFVLATLLVISAFCFSDFIENKIDEWMKN